MRRLGSLIVDGCDVNAPAKKMGGSLIESVSSRFSFSPSYSSSFSSTPSSSPSSSFSLPLCEVELC